MDTKNESLALLLDSAPITWTSQEDRHLLLCRELVKAGLQPVLIFSAPLKTEFEQRFLAAGAIVLSLSYKNGSIHFYRTLKQVTTRYNVTLVHIIFFDYFSPVAWIVRATGVKRIIYEMQNSGIFRATSWRRTLLRLRTRVMTAPMSRIIAISEFVKEQLIDAGVQESKILVRYLGVDNERFQPDTSARTEFVNTFKIRPDELILSTVSYLRPFKNPQVLVHACKELKNRNVAARLFVAGNGEMLSTLKELSQKLQVEENIHWLGNVDDPRNLLQSSDIFLLASTGEAFGLVLTEAMACGVPVVGTRSGSLPEVVDDGKTGLLVPPNDSSGLANAIQILSQDQRLRRDMAMKAVERVKQSFTVGKAVANTISIYHTLLTAK